MTEDDCPDALVGARLRSLRQAAGLSLDALARGSERSIGYISQIERGLSSPTLRDLAAFAKVLGVSFVDLLHARHDGQEQQDIRRQGDRTVIAFRGSGIEKRVLAPRNSGSIAFFIMQLGPDGTTGATPYAHDGEEAGYVLRGRIWLTIGEATHRLGPGDSFRFSSRTPHAFGALGRNRAEVLWINVDSASAAGRGR